MGDGNYWVSDAQGNGVEVYCDMTSDDEGWMLFGVLDSGSANIPDSQMVGSLSQGTIGDVGYSLELDAMNEDAAGSFDVRIEYGDTDTYTQELEGLTKNDVSFFTPPTDSGDGVHGLLGTGAVDGLFATYCTGAGECLAYEQDYFNFSRQVCCPKRNT